VQAAKVAEPAKPAEGAEGALAAAPADADGFVNPLAFDSNPSDLNVGEFEKLLADNPIVMVNFFAPWCFWSNKLTPSWLAVQQKLHARAYSKSIKCIRVDCTTDKGGELCRSQSVHAFPSVRIYRGSTHAFEPYEYGREENVLWLHLVKVAAEALVNEMNDADPAQKKDYSQQIAHVSADLRAVMDRRAQGLDEDWSEDALSPDEEVAEDRDLLHRISEAVGSITGAKGMQLQNLQAKMGSGGQYEGAHEGDVEEHMVNERASDVVLGLLSGRIPEERGGGEEGEEAWVEAETHEGCNLFGYVDVSRAPGTLHVSPHASRHSFDFSAVNTSHHIDHLSFGLELSARERSRLPKAVVAQLTTLDGSFFVAGQKRETKEHHVNIMPTSYGPADGSRRIETYQFTATSQGRTRDTLPHLMISYDVSPIHAHIVEKTTATSEFVVSLCAIIGGAVSVFGILDAMLFTTSTTLKKRMGGKGY